MKESLEDVPVEQDIELIDYLRVIWLRRRLIVFGTLLSIVLAGSLSLILPKKYEATAQIQIGRVWEKELENPYLTRERIGSDAFLSRLIEQLHLETTLMAFKRNGIVETEVVEGGTAGRKTALLLAVRISFDEPRQALNIAKTVAAFLIEDHLVRFQEKLQEHKRYEKELSDEVMRIDTAIGKLEHLITKQQMSPTVNAPSVILLQAQLEQKNVQLLNFKKELTDVRINNNSSIVTENTRLISPPILPVEPVNPRIGLNMAVAGVFGLFSFLVLAFFLEYLKNARLRERETAD